MSDDGKQSATITWTPPTPEQRENGAPTLAELTGAPTDADVVKSWLSHRRLVACDRELMLQLGSTIFQRENNRLIRPDGSYTVAYDLVTDRYMPAPAKPAAKAAPKTNDPLAPFSRDEILWRLNTLANRKTGDPVPDWMVASKGVALSKLARDTLSLLEVPATKCTYEARPYPRELFTGMNAPHGSWCTVHGWDCPNQGREGS